MPKYHSYLGTSPVHFSFMTPHLSSVTGPHARLLDTAGGGISWSQNPNQTNFLFPRGSKYLLWHLDPNTERIDHWFEPFFVKEIRRVIELLREIKTADQQCYNFLLIPQNKFFRLNVIYLLIMYKLLHVN